MNKFISFLLLLLLSTIAVCQQPVKPKIRAIPAKYTSPASGKEMFNSYCASCHGVDGKGDGPAAAGMKNAVPDITALSKSHGGTFPSFLVFEIIKGDSAVPSHGSADMPVWGPVFAHMSQVDHAEIQQRIHNLTDYVGSLQAK